MTKVRLYWKIQQTVHQNALETAFTQAHRRILNDKQVKFFQQLLQAVCGFRFL